MGKIYEALEQAQREQKGLEKPPPVLLPEKQIYPDMEIATEREMLVLYQNIDSLLNGSPKKVIQFIAANEGEGTSTIVREFAKVSAMLLGKSVLNLGVDRRNPSMPLVYNFKPDFGWEDVFKNEETLENTISRMGDTNSRVCLFSPQAVLSTNIIHSPLLKSFFEKLKIKFDLILIDSPPASIMPNGIVISRRVDGVVLVLEAEKTRWPVAENLKNQILKNGGNALGIVFNKRRYHIPEYIYNRL